MTYKRPLLITSVVSPDKIIKAIEASVPLFERVLANLPPEENCLMESWFKVIIDFKRDAYVSYMDKSDGGVGHQEVYIVTDHGLEKMSEVLNLDMYGNNVLISFGPSDVGYDFHFSGCVSSNYREVSGAIKPSKDGFTVKVDQMKANPNLEKLIEYVGLKRDELRIGSIQANAVEDALEFPISCYSEKDLLELPGLKREVVEQIMVMLTHFCGTERTNSLMEELRGVIIASHKDIFDTIEAVYNRNTKTWKGLSQLLLFDFYTIRGKDETISR